MKRFLAIFSLVGLSLLSIQCTSSGWQHWKPGNEFATVYKDVPIYAKPNPGAFTLPDRLLPKGERMALIDWLPREANVVLSDSSEGYVSTVEIAPVVDENREAVRSAIRRVLSSQPPSLLPVRTATPRRPVQLNEDDRSLIERILGTKPKPKATSSKPAAKPKPSPAPKPQVTPPAPTPAPGPPTPPAPAPIDPKPEVKTPSQIDRLYKLPPSAPEKREPEKVPEFRPLP